jgi:hypothetical protein
MKEWIEYNFGWQDWNKFRRRIFLILLFPLAFYVSIQSYWLIQSWYYSSSTYGTIVRVKPIEAISQSRYGSRNSVMGYRITFVYRVNGISYEQESIRIGYWSKPKGPLTEIWYHPEYPQKSVISPR